MTAGGGTRLRTRSGAADLITQLQYAHRQLMDLVGYTFGHSHPVLEAVVLTLSMSLQYTQSTVRCTANLLITMRDSTSKVKSLGYKYSVSIG